jgi:hypothetical protein
LLSDEGTKLVLEERIHEHIDNHPELEEDEEFTKYVQFRKRTSPKKSQQDVSSDGQILKPVDSKTISTPSKLFQIAKRFRGADSSPSKESHGVDDEEEKDEDSNAEDDDIELIENNEGEDRELLDEEEADSEYSPSYFEFVTKIQDWFIDQYESTLAFTEDATEEFKSSVVKKSASLKHSLSSAESINILTTSVELGLLLHQQIPVIYLKNASFLDQKILAKYSKFINPKWPVYDFAAFFDLKLIFVLVTWFVLSVVIPVITSYYINFIGKKSRKVKLDPFVFNISKLILAYLFLSGNVSFNDVKNNAEVWAEQHGLLDNASLLQHLRAHAFHNSITLRLILGNLPFINGAVGALVALYVAAI